MKLEVGMYVRTNLGIAKITAKHNSRIGNEFLLDKEIIDTHEDYYTNCMYDYKFYLEQIIKASNDITDLVEIGDYVNGHKVEQIWEDNQRFGGCDYMFNIDADDIKSILTKEQFEAMAYKVV